MEVLTFNQTIWPHVPEDCNLNCHCHVNLKISTHCIIHIFVFVSGKKIMTFYVSLIGDSLSLSTQWVEDWLVKSGILDLTHCV